jgi:hypothetical protein
MFIDCDFQFAVAKGAVILQVPSVSSASWGKGSD